MCFFMIESLTYVEMIRFVESFAADDAQVLLFASVRPHVLYEAARNREAAVAHLADVRFVVFVLRSEMFRKLFHYWNGLT